MALMHGDLRVSLRKLERLAGIRRLCPCAPQVAERLTGYQTGGICPFGLRTLLPVFVEESILALPELYINAGRRGVIALIRPQALRLVNARPGHFRSQGAPRP